VIVVVVVVVVVALFSEFSSHSWSVRLGKKLLFIYIVEVCLFLCRLLWQ